MMSLFKKAKEKLPEIPGVDGVIEEIAKRLMGGGKGNTVNITVNNYLMKKMDETDKKEEMKKKDLGDSVFESPKTVKGEKFI